MLDAGDFLDSLADYTDNSADSDTQRPIRLGTIDPAYNGAGRARVQFDGENALSTKGYAAVDYLPRPNERVVLLPVAKSYIILGKIDSAGGLNTYTSVTRPSSPVAGQKIFETDTKYERIWDGAQWNPVSWPEISAQYSRAAGDNTATGNNDMSWSSRTIVGDMGGSSVTQVFNRAGWYQTYAQTRVYSTDPIERFIDIHIYDASGTVQKILHTNQINSNRASMNVGGDFYVPVAGWYAKVVVYTSGPATMESGWYMAWNTLFTRPAT